MWSEHKTAKQYCQTKKSIKTINELLKTRLVNGYVVNQVPK